MHDQNKKSVFVGDIVCILEGREYAPEPDLDEKIFYLVGFGEVSEISFSRLEFLLRKTKIPNHNGPRLQRGDEWIPSYKVRLLLRMKYAHKYKDWQSLLALARLKFGKIFE